MAQRTSRLRMGLAWLAPILLMLLIFSMSSEPSFGESDYIASRLAAGLLPAWLTPLAPFLDAYLSIIVHVGEYAVLSLLLANALHHTPSVRQHTLWAAWLLATLYGISDEWHQSFVPGRTASWQDMAANTIGAGVGIVCWILLTSARKARSTQP